MEKKELERTFTESMTGKLGPDVELNPRKASSWASAVLDYQRNKEERLKESRDKHRELAWKYELQYDNHVKEGKDSDGEKRREHKRLALRAFRLMKKHTRKEININLILGMMKNKKTLAKMKPTMANEL